MATQLDGATTVAGTIIAAQLADIPVFVTGGIGKKIYFLSEYISIYDKLATLATLFA